MSKTEPTYNFFDKNKNKDLFFIFDCVHLAIVSN